jgi:hypothetical protein
MFAISIRCYWLQELGIVTGSAFFFANCALAQITPDITLPTNSRVRTSGNTSIIEGVDILGAAQISKYANVDLNPCNLCDNPSQKVPEPSYLFGLFAVAGVLTVSKKGLGVKRLPNFQKRV